MSDKPEKSLDERLASLERGLEHVKSGLGLLGVKPCTWCGTFYRRSDAGALCDDCGDSVCYRCIPQWWSHRCPELSPEDRQTAERMLSRWLIIHHDAEVIAKSEDLPKSERLSMKLVTGCEQCNSSGKTYTGGRCRRCDGRGTVWTVVRAPELRRSAE